MVEAEGQRLDGWTSANRALLGSPPPRGADRAKPVSRPMLDKSDQNTCLTTSCTRRHHSSMP